MFGSWIFWEALEPILRIIAYFRLYISTSKLGAGASGVVCFCAGNLQLPIRPPSAVGAAVDNDC